MYLFYDKKVIDNKTSEEDITAAYAEGFVLTRNAEEMDQTRSVRIHLPSFDLSSENRRILRKTEPLACTSHTLPMDNYSWEIGKLGKDFYDTKFGKGTFTANKIKDLLTNQTTSFTTLLTYSLEQTIIGYAICYQNSDIFHYSYPFYSLDADKNTGMGMMLRAILFAKEQGCTYIYLGSAQRPSDVYKLQFAGLEWFDKERDGFVRDDEKLKEILGKISTVNS